MNRQKLRKGTAGQYDDLREWRAHTIEQDPENSGRIEMLESLVKSIETLLKDADIAITKAKVSPVVYQKDSGFKGEIEFDGYKITIRERNERSS